MSFVYDLIILVYSLIYLPYLLFSRRGYAGFGIRFSLFPSELKKQTLAKTNVWVHAVSVGEVMALNGFIDRLKARFPSYQLVVTVTTKTGYSLACQQFKDKAVVMPSPIDFSFVDRRFIALIKPKLYIGLETEIWPNLYRQLSFQRIPIVVINGRISDNSYGRYKAVRIFLKGTLDRVNVWCMQSDSDAQRIKRLGADPSRVFVTGNIKFDDAPRTSDISGSDILNGQDGPWWVAGSTHPGEEEIVLNVYGKLIRDDPRWRLVIVPRHIERAPKVKELADRLGFKDVIVIDTIGQLRSLYSKASLVFVGKSLCVGGGHNIIEPALYGKAIIIGPMVSNFRDIAACFKKADALVQVEDAGGFEKAVRELCRDGFKRDALGAAAREVINENQGATQRSLAHMAGFLK